MPLNTTDMMSQTDNQPPEVAGQEPAGKRRRKSSAPREVHHHHYHERKPRDIDMSGDPYEVVQGRVNARKTRKALGAWAAEVRDSVPDRWRRGDQLVFDTLGATHHLTIPRVWRRGTLREVACPASSAQAGANEAIRRKFSAAQTSFHSARTRSMPRRLNWRNPSTLLIQPLGGSAIHLRLR